MISITSSVFTSRGEGKTPPTIGHSWNFGYCATRVFVDVAPENPRERNFVARSSQEHLMILSDTVYTETMRSRNHRSAPKGNMSYTRWLQFFTWLVALAVEEKLCSSFLHC